MASTIPDRRATRLESGGLASGEAARGRLLVVNVKGFFRADPLHRALAVGEVAAAAGAERWYALERMLYRRAVYVFSASDYVTRSLVGDYGVDPARVVTVGEGSRLEASDGPTKHYDGKTVLYVGYEF